MSLLIQNGRVVDPAGGIDAVADVLIADGRIAKVGRALKAPAGTELIDATGQSGLPGLHRHARAPARAGLRVQGDDRVRHARRGRGRVHRGGLHGQHLPVNDNRAVTDYILARAQVEGVVRVYPIGAVTGSLEGGQLAEIAELAEAGCVAFSDDGKCVMNAGAHAPAPGVRAALRHPDHRPREDCHLAREARMNEGLVATELGLSGAARGRRGRDGGARHHPGRADRRPPAHRAHLDARARSPGARGQARGLRVTAEVAPHHLVLTDEAVRGYNPNCKMAPPLRTEARRRGVLARRSPTAPSTASPPTTPRTPPSEKEGEFDEAANGIVGLETAVPSCSTVWCAGRGRPAHRWSPCSAPGPPALLNLPGGSLARARRPTSPSSISSGPSRWIRPRSSRGAGTRPSAACHRNAARRG